MSANHRIVIGLHGLPGVGKDVAADILVSQLGFTKLAFADRLKAELISAFNCPRELFYEHEFKAQPHILLSLSHCTNKCFINWYQSGREGLGDIEDSQGEFWFAPRSPRWLMQHFGDFRRSQNPNYFIEKLQDQIDMLPCSLIVVSDVRYDNEAKAILANQPSRIWEISRIGYAAPDGHSSNVRLSQELITQSIKNDRGIGEFQFDVSATAVNILYNT